MKAARDIRRRDGEEETVEASVRRKDPVCGMEVGQGSPHRVSREGTEYGFCSAGCLAAFRKDPGRYVEGREPAEEPPGEEKAEPARSVPGGEYTCPMHPEVRQPGPGSCPKCGMALEPVAPVVPVSRTKWTCPRHPEVVRDAPGDCPKCGMALEPRTVSAEEEESTELVDMLRRFWVSAVLTVPLFLVAMADFIPGRPLENLASPRTLGWLEFAFGTPVVLWGGGPFFVKGWPSIVNRSLNMFPLIGLGVGVAYLYSLVAALFPGIFPASFRGESGEVAVYFEAAAVIVTLVLLGQVLELKARSQTGAAIKALLGLAPKTARRFRDDGSDEDVPLDLVRPGDRLRVRAGGKVPGGGAGPRRRGGRPGWRGFASGRSAGSPWRPLSSGDWRAPNRESPTP